MNCLRKEFMNMRYLCLLILGCLCNATAQLLYDPEPPANTSFIRVVNATNSAQKIEIGNRQFDTIQPSFVTPYHLTPEGKQVMVFASRKVNLKFSAQKYYTIIAREGAPLVFEDATSDKTKAIISLYNLSQLKAVSLKTDDNKITVIADTNPSTVKSQAVNAIKIGFLVTQNTKKLTEFPTTQLERGMSYSTFVFGPTKAIWVKNVTQK
jgi:alginate O-acetyltransferase complex protein AlgF